MLCAAIINCPSTLLTLERVGGESAEQCGVLGDQGYICAMSHSCCYNFFYGSTNTEQIDFHTLFCHMKGNLVVQQKVVIDSAALLR